MTADEFRTTAISANSHAELLMLRTGVRARQLREFLQSQLRPLCQITPEYLLRQLKAIPCNLEKYYYDR